MKKYAALFFVFTLLIFSLSAHDGVKELSTFKMMGEIELRNEPDFKSHVVYTTLNHEFGLEVRVLEFGEKDTYKAKKGQWIYALTTAPMWTSSGEWVDAYSKFWFFLPDDEELFEYEELN